MSGWYYARQGVPVGPVSAATLRRLAADGALSPADFVLEAGTHTWVLASSLKGLFPQAPPPPEITSRQQALAEAHVVPEAGNCVQCGICSYNCPMEIDVRAHAWRGKPIHDCHCLTCGECVKRCPRGVLRFECLPLLRPS
jgi:ferredoxin